MTILDNNIAVLEGDPNVSTWVREAGKLCHDETVTLQILPWLRPGDVVVDAGAYIGTYAFPMWEKIQPGGVLYAFEPNPKAFMALAHNVPGAKAYNVALGEQTDLELFYEHPGNYGASYLPGKAGDTKVMPLDRFELSALRLFKIDVEGMEPEVLRGAWRTITSWRPVIFMEINHGTLERRGNSCQEILDMLRGIDYEVQLTNENHTFNPKEWPQIDVVFRPKELSR